mgnify:CR=1 FL=1
MKINTVKLQEMITQASKGSGNNKLIPITSMMLIELKQNKLTLVTTDATNYLYVTADNIDFKSFQQREIIIPPIYLQGAFEVFCKQVDKSKFEVQRSLDEAQKLFDSLMQEYFS